MDKRDGTGAGDVQMAALPEHLLKALPQAVIATDVHGTITYWNPAAEQLYGWTAAEVLGRKVLEVTPSAFTAELAGAVMRQLTAGATWEGEILLQHRNGSTFLAAVADTPVLNHAGELVGIIGISTDITEQQAAREALARSTRELKDAQRLAHLGNWSCDATWGQIVFSDEMFRLLGYEPGEITPSADQLLALVDPADADRIRALMADLDQTLERRLVEISMQTPQGLERWMILRMEVVLDSDGCLVGHRGTCQDVTEQHDAEEALTHQGLHDPLTGLPNRVLLLDRLRQAMARISRQSSTVGLFFVDVDRFKVVNDSLGHRAGDQLLLAVAARLQTLLRPGDTLACLGGDEFVLLCDSLVGEGEAVDIVERMTQAMAEPLAWEGGDLVVTVSIGIAVTSSPDVTAESLLEDAGAALHEAKTQGRARSAVFAEAMRSQAIDRLETEVALRASITERRFRVAYQPIVNLADGRISSHEALVRWEHPKRGLLGPAEFIPIAEETGLIVPLGAWVLGEACRQTRVFQRSDPQWSALTLTVNLSGHQIAHRDLIPLVHRTLEESGLQPRHLHLEMTESVLMQDAPATINILRALRDLGVHLSIDDFGTGYSSLSYLRAFPVDTLKIDRSFVDGLGRNSEASAIVGAIISLAAALDLAVVAEGVENEMQREILLELGCSLGQGYLFAQPQLADAAQALLDHRAQLMAETLHRSRQGAGFGQSGRAPAAVTPAGLGPAGLGPAGLGTNGQPLRLGRLGNPSGVSPASAPPSRTPR